MPTGDAQALKRNTLIGFAVSIALAGMKLAAGIVGHSSALVADAVESLADTAGSIIVWQALRVADRPPDEAHPYGYGKAEAVAALLVGVLLILAAVWIAIRAVEEIITPHRAPASWTLLVLLATIGVKEGLFRFVLRGAKQFESEAARADAWHHRADAITSAVAVVGVAAAVWGPPLLSMPRLVLADEVAAILAAGIILVTALRLSRSPLSELLDAAAPDLVRAVRETASCVEGVRLVEKVHARKSGRGYHIDMHLHVPAGMTVRDAHALSGKVKAIIRADQPGVIDVLIHIEPDEGDVGTVKI